MRPISNSWSKLKSYELEPPSFLSEQVFESIREIDFFSPDEIRDLTLNPPLFLLEKIESKVQGVSKISPDAASKTDNRMTRRIIAAAAILVAIATTVVIISIAPKIQKQRIPAIAKATVDSFSKPAPIPEKHGVEPLPTPEKDYVRDHKAVQKSIPTDTFEYFSHEQDLWARLVSFEYNDKDYNWLESNNKVTLTIDEYSSLQVSRPLIEMIKHLHDTKRNGKPSGKARRIKKRLEKWKEKDEKYFSQNKSALDPIDLAGLLFNQ